MTGAADIDDALPPSGHVIVCGLSELALRIVEQLHAAGETVVVVDDRGQGRLLRILESLEIQVYSGDPRRPEMMEHAGVHGAVALICADDADLRNLEIALLARDLRPDLRVVSQLSNAAVGNAVARLTGEGSVLDVASLSAPSFVEACVLAREHEFELAGVRFLITERVVDLPGPLRHHFGDLAPIAVVPADGGEILVCPGRDVLVGPGDTVTMIGSEDDFHDIRPPGHAVPTADRHESAALGALTRGWRLARGFAGETQKPLRFSVTVLLVIAIISVVVLVAGYRGVGGKRMGVLDGAYFTVETLTTVGFGDFYFGNQAEWLRLWAIFLMIAGATLVTVLYAMLTDLLVTRRLAASAGRRAASGLHDHVVLIGLGSVGYRVLASLMAIGRHVVVLESDPNNRFLPQARALGAAVIIADATIPENLLATNLHAASAVAVLTSNDLANIETGLAVDDLLGARSEDVPVVLRVFDRQLATTIENNFHFHHVRSTSALSAPWFVGAALGLTILNTFYVGGQPFLLGQLTVSMTGGLQGRSMSEVGARIRIVAIARAADAQRMEYPPRRDTRFAPGDQAYVVGPYEQLLQLLRHEKS